MATRREFLIGALGACAAPAAFASAPAPKLLSAGKLGSGDVGVVWSADSLVTFALPARGHAPARLPDGRLLVMGRRPGLYATMADARDPAAATSFGPASGYRFAGHAAVSPDGASLVTGELGEAGYDAQLVVRDPRTGAERARWTPGGIEPHELVFADGGARLIAAIGGLPQDGGVKGPAFNPGGIDSAVVEVDPRSGKVLARRKSGAASLSWRHLALAPDGKTVAVAAQDQDIAVTRPLVGVMRLGREIEAVSWPDPKLCDFRSYIGSVAIDRSGSFIAAASPRGSVLGVWSLGDGRFVGFVPIADVCGLAPTAEPGGFWASTGLGKVLKIAASGPRIDAQWHAATGFDHHLVEI